MLKKIGFSLWVIASLSNNLYAEAAGSIGQYGIEINIKSKDVFERTNFFGKLSGVCTIYMDRDKTTFLSATVLRPTILLRDKEVTDPKLLTIQEGTTFKLSASFGASLRLKNEGDYDIKVICEPDF